VANTARGTVPLATSVFVKADFGLSSREYHPHFLQYASTVCGHGAHTVRLTKTLRGVSSPLSRRAVPPEHGGLCGEGPRIGRTTQPET
jgi:hypothetical protein